MARHERLVEDDTDQALLDRGWLMVGLAGWNHPTTGLRFFTKEQAAEYDLGDYHSIKQEHAKMLQLLMDIARDGYEDDREAAWELLTSLGYEVND